MEIAGIQERDKVLERKKSHARLMIKYSLLHMLHSKNNITVYSSYKDIRGTKLNYLEVHTDLEQKQC
jgi:hypothetical protein